MSDVDYRCHRIRFQQSSRLWFAYIFPPSGPRALDKVVTATLAEGGDEALRRARLLIDQQG